MHVTWVLRMTTSFLPPHVPIYNFINEANVSRLNIWSSHSPDINPVEYLWDRLNWHFYALPIPSRTLIELADHLANAWITSSQQDIDFHQNSCAKYNYEESSLFRWQCWSSILDISSKWCHIAAFFCLFVLYTHRNVTSLFAKWASFSPSFCKTITIMLSFEVWNQVEFRLNQIRSKPWVKEATDIPLSLLSPLSARWRLEFSPTLDWRRRNKRPSEKSLEEMTVKFDRQLCPAQINPFGNKA